MLIRYFSDLHLEQMTIEDVIIFLREIPTGDFDEICVCAGDIGNPQEKQYDIFMTFISKKFRKTFIIAGNHEYYHRPISATNTILENYFTKFDNVTFLNNKYEYYEDHCFIGCTLWSKITNIQYPTQDVYAIADFTQDMYNDMNEQCVEFLCKTIEKQKCKCVVITHHLPLYELIDAKYKTMKMQAYNQWLYCDMNNDIERLRTKIACWIYGHTHSSSVKKVFGIPFLCNPAGYPEENDKIDFSKTVKL